MRAVIYARYSSDRQREASIEDQFRQCEAHATAEGWQVVARFKDEAISGSRADRPGYQDMLRGAMAREFEVLVVEGLDRISRDSVESERVIRRLEHRGIRIVGINDYDSASGKGRKLLRGVRGLLNEAYLDDLREKTHRGLEGQALKGNNAGGRTYGYRHVPVEDSARRDPLGRPVVVAVRREIDEQQAEVVRRIFAWYADGRSARWMAEQLNRDGVPSPGSTWNRRRSNMGWSATAIWGPMDHTGILNNELYVGRYVWNRSRWTKDPDTGRRQRKVRPESEWVVHELPDLRIIDDKLWNRVRQRQAERADRVGARVRAGLTRAAAQHIGPPGKYLFSTLLKCDVCGASMVMRGKTHYACASQVNGRKPFCTNKRAVKRSIVESTLLADLQRKLLAPEVVDAVCKAVPKRLAGAMKVREGAAKRIAELDSENGRLAESVARMGGSAVLEARLAANEREKAKLDAAEAVPVAKVTRLLPRLAESYRALVADLASVPTDDIPRARAELRRFYGGAIRVRPAANCDYLEARVPNADRLFELAVVNGTNLGKAEAARGYPAASERPET